MAGERIRSRKARAGVSRDGQARHIADPQLAGSLERSVDEYLHDEGVELFLRMPESRTP